MSGPPAEKMSLPIAKFIDDVGKYLQGIVHASLPSPPPPVDPMFHIPVAPRTTRTCTRTRVAFTALKYYASRPLHLSNIASTPRRLHPLVHSPHLKAVQTFCCTESGEIGLA